MSWKTTKTTYRIEWEFKWDKSTPWRYGENGPDERKDLIADTYASLRKQPKSRFRNVRMFENRIQEREFIPTPSQIHNLQKKWNKRVQDGIHTIM